ncbi:hypothetical protein LZ30DRAFT_775646 [Colletotrichum cereale]|nr:hypothetical protein LZ30DRAFT_775646 [Colletotrichum cereale]
MKRPSTVIIGKEVGSEIQAPPDSPQSDKENRKQGDDGDNTTIITGADASRSLMRLQVDFGPSLTFRSMVLATCLSAFQAVMSQIYTVSQQTIHARPTVEIFKLINTWSWGLKEHAICFITATSASNAAASFQTLQGLHWQDSKNSKLLPWFRYSFTAIFIHEFFPTYILPLAELDFDSLSSRNECYREQGCGAR